jgi:hypothetical protein
VTGLLILIGCLGLLEFGGLWVAVHTLGAERLAATIGQYRRQRVDRWLRRAPRLVVVSLALLALGLALRLV